ncbi:MULTISPECIES: cytochrome P450 [unclassified Mycobacterium]|uniref:cytochrome P450 n=1 Tax=unclassified Mycobacterium TaxID=2642494 RepID=UPI0029C92C6D|nr:MULTISPECIES: cytochrome P450 [unclassified Mycobacterium]
MATATTDPVRLPPGPRAPKVVQLAAFLTARDRAMRAVARRYGTPVTVNLPGFANLVVVSDPDLVKDVFTTDADLLGEGANLGQVLGPGSTFSLDGAAHRQRRKLLVPPFHGGRIRAYERIVEDEVMRETAGWPDGDEFATLPSMMRITLNAIVRAVFGADGDTFDELRQLLPDAVLLGSRMTAAPAALRRDWGRFSPGGRLDRYRRRYDTIVQQLIDNALNDPSLDERTDVLALLLRARYDDGTRISDQHLADELLTLLTAGHETTATTLAWTVERLRRHPRLLDELSDDLDADSSELCQATIWEVQRTRPVIQAAIRTARTRIRLGEWVLPEGSSIAVAIGMAHASEHSFPHADSFDPTRFLGAKPATNHWIPYGGGVRRCVGATFANMEMTVVLRTLLREFTLLPTADADEPSRSRGVAVAPGRGGLAAVQRRVRCAPTGPADRAVGAFLVMGGPD